MELIFGKGILLESILEGILQLLGFDKKSNLKH